MSETVNLNRALSDEEVTKVYLEQLKKEQEDKKNQPDKKPPKSASTGVKDYPILVFDKESLERLRQGVQTVLDVSTLKPAGGKCYEIAKRAFDIVASLCGLFVLAFPMGVIALMIYAEDKGNPFFSQVRLTKGGKPFKMYKLRTMCVDAEARFAEVQKQNQSDGLAFKSDDDPRITKIGKFLRRTSIDELPQLVNVLMGSMSVIGPRPPLPREVVLYTPDEMNRLMVKGGLSCICQTEGRSDMEFDKWVESDVEYIKTRSALLDLKLIFKTVDAVIKKKGAK